MSSGVLDADERRAIERVIEQYPRKSNASVEGLLVVQQRRGWVPDDALVELAGMLEMSPAALDGIATFYSRIYRKPTGRHVVAVCDSVSCFVLGGETLLAHLERKLGIEAGQTTADGVFTLLPAACLGHCDEAPVMMVDDRVYGRLNEAKIERILEEASRQEERLEPEA